MSRSFTTGNFVATCMLDWSTVLEHYPNALQPIKVCLNEKDSCVYLKKLLQPPSFLVTPSLRHLRQTFSSLFSHSSHHNNAPTSNPLPPSAPLLSTDANVSASKEVQRKEVLKEVNETVKPVESVDSVEVTTVSPEEPEEVEGMIFCTAITCVQ